MQAAPAWQQFQARQEKIAAECGDCAYFKLCNGGCPYDVLAASGGTFNGTLRDPRCPSH